MFLSKLGELSERYSSIYIFFPLYRKPNFYRDLRFTPCVVYDLLKASKPKIFNLKKNIFDIARRNITYFFRRLYQEIRVVVRAFFKHLRAKNIHFNNTLSSQILHCTQINLPHAKQPHMNSTKHNYR